MSFVQVQNARRDSHRFQRAEASHAEQQFLANSNAPIAAVQARGKFAILGRIPLHVRIEKKQIAASHFHPPDFRPDRSAARLDLHRDGFAVGADRRFHRQMVDVRLQVFFLLPAVAIERCRKYPWP